MEAPTTGVAADAGRGCKPDSAESSAVHRLRQVDHRAAQRVWDSDAGFGCPGAGMRMRTQCHGVCGMSREQGSFIGQDVDRDMIRWYQALLGRSNIRFIHADIYSKVYNPGGTPMSDYALPIEGRSCDLVLATSRRNGEKARGQAAFRRLSTLAVRMIEIGRIVSVTYAELS
jgi:hypothetical protein